MLAAAEAGSGSRPGSAAGAPPLSARRRGLAAWGKSAAEVKDDGWARDGWQGSAKSGAGEGGTHRVTVGAGTDSSKASTGRAGGDSGKELGRRGKKVGSRRSGAALRRLPAKVSQALSDSSAHAGGDVSDGVGARGGRSLPLVAKSGAARHESQSGKKARRRPFQPRNNQYILDALEASPVVKQSQVQGDQEKVKKPIDLVEKVTGFKQVSKNSSSHAYFMPLMKLYIYIGWMLAYHCHQHLHIIRFDTEVVQQGACNRTRTCLCTCSHLHRHPYATHKRKFISVLTVLKQQTHDMVILTGVHAWWQVPRDPKELDAELISGDGGDQMKRKGSSMQASGEKAAGWGSGKGSGKDSGGYLTQIAAIRVKTKDPKVGSKLLKGASCQIHRS